ncbi:hypothetical protein [Candidatus Bathycorpusculum sp.]|uniref:hypothetical protein n=1 Tax=Candidatus Bathycorpusculum sp. TaxID=2994959 RepID=UPI00282D8225|nr:hypothetical protein [Candidatus Termitimicrobium sp.]MCL2684986.1 hypothetical protein [Candidatus Termitimicrobium sp.]
MNDLTQRIKTKEIQAFQTLQNDYISIFNDIMFLFDDSATGVPSGRGIVGMSIKKMPYSKTLTVKDINGKILINASKNTEHKTKSISSLKIGNLKILFKENELVEVSEYAKGVKGALSNVRFTPSGKLTGERLDAVSLSSKPFEPIRQGDGHLVQQKVVEAMKEITPRIPSRVPWGNIENIFTMPSSETLHPVYNSQLEKLMRSSIR